MNSEICQKKLYTLIQYRLLPEFTKMQFTGIKPHSKLPGWNMNDL